MPEQAQARDFRVVPAGGTTPFGCKLCLLDPLLSVGEEGWRTRKREKGKKVRQRCWKGMRKGIEML